MKMTIGSFPLPRGGGRNLRVLFGNEEEEPDFPEAIEAVPWESFDEEDTLFKQTLTETFAQEHIDEETEEAAVLALRNYFRALRGKKEQGDEYQPPLTSLNILLQEALTTGVYFGRKGTLQGSTLHVTACLAAAQTGGTFIEEEGEDPLAEM